jgi:hypothetical protein
MVDDKFSLSSTSWAIIGSTIGTNSSELEGRFSIMTIFTMNESTSLALRLYRGATKKQDLHKFSVDQYLLTSSGWSLLNEKDTPEHWVDKLPVIDKTISFYDTIAGIGVWLPQPLNKEQRDVLRMILSKKYYSHDIDSFAS